jgi:ABC-type transport system involved in cytochrome c biogenesis permease subunit
MASDASIRNDVSQAGALPRQGGFSLRRDVVKPLGSLKLTVTLFAMSIFIVLVGTLAQVDKDMWEVINDYFRSYIAWIDFQVFFPRSWFPAWQNISGGFWFPGGALIGLGLVINLTAAHAVRFKFHASGGRLAAGVFITGVGALITALVIYGGHSNTAQQDQPPFATWAEVWMLVKLAVGGAAVACLYATASAISKGAEKRSEQVLLGGLTVLFGSLALYLFVAGEKAYLGDSGMRILWQLIKAEVPALILLFGLWLMYAKRAGIVLLHGGLALMMFGQFYVANYDVEEQMRIEEGQTINYGRDIRQTELAIVDSSNAEQDDVVVIPISILLTSDRGGPSRWFGGDAPVGPDGVISHPDLPFDVKVEEYFKNARLRDAQPEDDNPATDGTGKRFIASPAKASSGTDSQVDFAAAYVTFLMKGEAEKIGTYMLSQIASSQEVSEQVTVEQTTYDVSLRFKRNYKPYSVTLLDVRKDDYLGTSTPRNYSSDIRLVDAERDVDRKIHIWMNNPLRYAGETFYQSGYAGPPDFPRESTTLQVVTNSGWLIPYVACMLVATGMLAHFWLVLMRFLRRKDKTETLRWAFSGAGKWLLRGRPASSRQQGSRDKPRKSQANSDLPTRGRKSTADLLGNLALALLLLVLVGWLAAKFRSPQEATDEMKIHEFGRLPLIADGRVKPFDTLARNSLRLLSNRETFKDDAGEPQPAIRWLLDTIADPAASEKHRVLRIVNLEVLDLLDLKRRKGNLYAIEEIRPRVAELEKEVIKAREKAAEKLSTYERKLIELDQRIRTYTRIGAAFQPPNLPPLPTEEDFRSGTGPDGQEVPETERRKKAEEKLRDFRNAYLQFVRSLDSVRPALAVPTPRAEEDAEEPEWQAYARAWTEASLAYQLGMQEPPVAVQHLEKMFHAYRNGNVKEFNRAVEDHQDYLAEETPGQLVAKKSAFGDFVKRTFGNFYAFEAYFNHVAPFYHSSLLYLIAFVLATLAWLGWSGPLNRTAFLLIAVTFIAHSAALLARMYISGRPPVTNLYSSAVFIGWGVVAFGLIYEGIFRNGIGNVIASALGFGSLVVAHYLADGDTFTVLQAVLDTQFWLATHVVTVALGYATTFVAGGLGVLFVLRGFLTPTLDKNTSKELTRMIYGTVCFSIFFSFIGTVLGGLWADDSWGRFWGWDPKENGALIIVLWNALVLHARWGGLVRERGLAVLAVGGNIVTSWSWFGVNELGVGLHSYGFTEGALRNLMLFNATQLGIIVVGMLPLTLWWSYRFREPELPPEKLATE